jgi:hypothetical protein
MATVKETRVPGFSGPGTVAPYLFVLIHEKVDLINAPSYWKTREMKLLGVE